MPQKQIAQERRRMIVMRRKPDIIDAWITSWSAANGVTGVYSFDKDLSRL